MVLPSASVSAFRAFELFTFWYTYEREMRKVVQFARPLKAGIDLLHFSEAGEIALDKPMTEKIFTSSGKT